MPTAEQTSQRDTIFEALEGRLRGPDRITVLPPYRLDVPQSEDWRIDIMLYKQNKVCCKLNMDLPATGRGTGLYIATPRGGRNSLYDAGCTGALKSIANLLRKRSVQGITVGDVTKNPDVESGWYVPVRFNGASATSDADHNIALGQVVMEVMAEWANRCATRAG